MATAGSIQASPRIGTTTTDRNGTYTFANLPTTGNGGGDAPAEYIVDVTDTAALFDGAWHSVRDGRHQRQQTRPTRMRLRSAGTASPNIVSRRLGYFIEPAAMSNFIWADTDGNGIQDGGEAGIARVDYLAGHNLALMDH